jgi:hypothetical protein
MTTYQTFVDELIEHVPEMEPFYERQLAGEGEVSQYGAIADLARLAVDVLAPLGRQLAHSGVAVEARADAATRILDFIEHLVLTDDEYLLALVFTGFYEAVSDAGKRGKAVFSQLRPASKKLYKAVKWRL